MNYGPIVFLSAFLALAASWSGFVLAPQLQLGTEPQLKALGTGDAYPQPLPGEAAQGADLYRSYGCVYCHSQRVEQKGVRAQMILTEVGTNPPAVLEILSRLNAGYARADLNSPEPTFELPDTQVVGPIAKDLGELGAKARVEVQPYGPDVSRGWGRRRSVAADYGYDHPVQIGGLRVGPDLANVGVRLPDADWHLRHLYAPQVVVEGSTMPAYRFLFEQHPVGSQPSPDALELPPGYAPEAGYEIVPTEAAHKLVSYLLSLRRDTALEEAPYWPVPVPLVDTNSAASVNP